MNNFPIGIFDSGVGGLSVLNQCKKLLPDENFVYVFDRSHAPYGNKSDDEIKTCVLAVAKKLENLHCKAIVAGCNTASETAMSMLRKKDRRACNRSLSADCHCCRKMCGRQSFGFVYCGNGKAEKLHVCLFEGGKEQDNRVAATFARVRNRKKF